jgi:hypothetical protein
MKSIKTILLSSAVILVTTAAFAQTQPAQTPMRTGAGGPNSINTDGPAGNTKATSGTHMKQTTGSGAQSGSMQKSPAKESADKAKSPASTNAGINQEK